MTFKFKWINTDENKVQMTINCTSHTFSSSVSIKRFRKYIAQTDRHYFPLCNNCKHTDKICL